MHQQEEWLSGAKIFIWQLIEQDGDNKYYCPKHIYMYSLIID